MLFFDIVYSARFLTIHFIHQHAPHIKIDHTDSDRVNEAYYAYYAVPQNAL